MWWEDKVALSPWDGLKDLSPLGSIIRLRRKVYHSGGDHRAEGNKTAVNFPKSADEMPA